MLRSPTSGLASPRGSARPTPRDPFDGSFQACASCGSLKVRPAPPAEEEVLEVVRAVDLLQCARCGFHGLAATFVSVDEYRSFVDELRHGRLPDICPPP